MPDWHDILEEVRTSGSTFDIIRRKYVQKLYEKTGRNVITYYSGWLQKGSIPGIQVNDADKDGLMTVIHTLDPSKGLDLILHTPGGETAATESIIDYLKSIFGNDIRAIVPQLAMSAGTVIACSCKEIVMGKQSSLGPIDPQIRGLAAHGIVEEFDRAFNEIKADPTKQAVWAPILHKYHPTLLGECQKSIMWTNQIVEKYLSENMLLEDTERVNKLQTILAELGDHSLNLSHSRHLSAKKCEDIGLNIFMMEEDDDLQDLILSVHHSCIQTLSATQAVKIIENHLGKAFILQGQYQINNNQ